MRLLFATVGMLFSVSASAVDLSKSAVMLDIYDRDCAPLPQSWRETVDLILQVMPPENVARERIRVGAIQKTNQAMFCDVAKSEVDKLTGGKDE